MPQRLAVGKAMGAAVPPHGEGSIGAADPDTEACLVPSPKLLLKKQNKTHGSMLLGLLKQNLTLAKFTPPDGAEE